MRYPTPTTALIAAVLSPCEELEVQCIAADVAESRRENPIVEFPEPILIWMLEKQGIFWNPGSRQWTPETDIPYRPTTRGMALLAREG